MRPVRAPWQGKATLGWDRRSERHFWKRVEIGGKPPLAHVPAHCQVGATMPTDTDRNSALHCRSTAPSAGDRTQ